MPNIRNIHFLSNSAFTLMELMLSVIIIGIIASLALPRYFYTMEKVKSAEGMEILRVLLNAQKTYNYENSSYASNINNLDVTIPTSSNFNTPTVAASNPIASIVRPGANTYTLTIDSDGKIKCTSGVGGICSKIGCTGAAAACN